ncbi:MAG: peptidylprolyl isomerase [Terriglobia bacterium]|jgi:peptidyl-prolyl cis-trans isomerase SurA
MRKPLFHHSLTVSVLFTLLAGLAALTSCQRKSPSDREIVASVDGQPIYRDQVERVYRSRQGASPDANSPEEAMSFKLNVLDELINNQILVDHASHAGITVSEAEVDNEVAKLQTPYSAEEFRKRLHDQGLEMDDLRKELRRNLTITKLINKEIVSSIKITDADIADYYQRNKANFNVPETAYHLAQIEVTPVADPEVRNLKNDDAKTPAAAERKIQALYARLRAGDDFATVAQEYSEDARTASGGGDMGFIPVSALASTPQLKQAVEALQVNQYTGIIRSSSGYHIIKLLGIEPAGTHTLSELRVQNAIRQTLRNEREQLLKAAYIETLRDRAKVENYTAEQIVKGQVSPPAAK